MTTLPKFQPHFEPSAQSMKEGILYHLRFSLARDKFSATKRDWWLATSKAVQERIIDRMIATQAVHHDQDVKRVYYLSLEFLMGRLFSNSLYSAGLFKETEEALRELGLAWRSLRGEEYDMGLGNGGLGRLAACFLDSLATLDYPAIGYGIHYEFGLFRQEFSNGHQIELPDDWMRFGTPWEIVRPEYTQEVELYGQVENVFDDQGNYVPRWVNTKTDPRRPLRYPDARLRHQHGELSAPVGIAAAREDQSRGVQPRRLQRGAGREGPERDGLQGPLPERQDRGGQGAAARPAILLRLVLAARHHPPLPHAAPHLERLSRQGGDPAQRHASRRWPCVELMRILHDEQKWRGTRRGASSPAPSPTPTTRCCPRRWKNGASRFSGASCRATCRSSSRSTSACWRRVEAAYPGDDGEEAGLLPHRGGRRADGPHGQPRRRGLPRGQRGGGAAHRAAQEASLPRVRRPLSRQIPEQDQRHHAAPLAARPAIRASPALVTSKIGDALGQEPRRTPRARAMGRRSRVPARVHGDQAREQGRPGRDHPGGMRRRRSPRTRSSTCRSSACTSTSAST